jgi:putative hydrolase of the HAD superfamily
MSKLDRFGVVVFDLDDTLYPEADYVRSGFQHVAELVERLYGKPFASLLRAAQQAEAADALGHALQAAQLPAGLKEHLLHAYRYHRPRLRLFDGAMALIERCRARGCPLYLVTDGRSLTQRLKIEALGLSEVFDQIFISEEIGHAKPHPLAFSSIVERGGEGPWVYVADNPSKDFVAPHALGWTTIGVRHSEVRVHDKPSLQEPSLWVERLLDLL